MIRTTPPPEQPAKKRTPQYVLTKKSTGTFYCKEYSMCIAPGICRSQIRQNFSKCHACGGVQEEEYTAHKRDMDAYYDERGTNPQLKPKRHPRLNDEE